MLKDFRKHRDGGAELRVGELEIKIQHFVCFSGKLYKCFKAQLFQHYIWKKVGGYSPCSPPGSAVPETTVRCDVTH